MSLRVRLTLYFSIIVVLPLAVAALAARTVFVEDLERRASSELEVAVRAVADRVDVIRLRAADLGDDLAVPDRGLGAALVAGDRDTVQRVVDAAVGHRGRVDVVVVTGADGAMLAHHLTPPSTWLEVAVPGVDDLARATAASEAPAMVLGEVRPIVAVDGQPLGNVLAGRWADNTLAAELRGGIGQDVTILVGGRITASTVPAADASSLADPLDDRVSTVDLGGRRAMARGIDVAGLTVVMSMPRAPIDAAARLASLALLAMLAAAATAAAALGWLVAALVVRPVRELADTALAVAGGDLDRKLDVRGRDELGVLAAAFNTMTYNVRSQMRELQVSRDALQRSVARMGETLSSTLDLNRTLSAVVDAAMSAATAERGALHMLAAGRTELYLKVARGLPRELLEARIPVGEGVVGWVAQTGSAARLPQDRSSVPTPSRAEPHASATLAVPLFSPKTSLVIGVLSLHGREDGQPFDEADLHTIRSFGAQASVAIENVRLHEATQHASVTDSLTGLWNMRYFQQRADEEVERAGRFGHPLTMVIADVDHFKDVNDRHGHLVGDQVLVEVSRRVSAQVREVDTLARYGGEELVLVLPETDARGAVRTAERIREAVAAEPIAAGSAGMRVTVSLGIAAFPDHGTTATDLLRQADQAMYAAKEAGRNRVSVARATPTIPRATPLRRDASRGKDAAGST